MVMALFQQFSDMPQEPRMQSQDMAMWTNPITGEAEQGSSTMANYQRSLKEYFDKNPGAQDYYNSQQKPKSSAFDQLGINQSMQEPQNDISSVFQRLGLDKSAFDSADQTNRMSMLQQLQGGFNQMSAPPAGQLEQDRRAMQPPSNVREPHNTVMGRLENVDNNVQGIARQLGVQNNGPRSSLPSAFQNGGVPQGGIGAFLNSGQLQNMSAPQQMLNQRAQPQFQAMSQKPMLQSDPRMMEQTGYSPFAQSLRY